MNRSFLVLISTFVLPASLSLAKGKPPAKPAASSPAQSGKASPAQAAFWKWFVDNARSLRDDKNLERVMNVITERAQKVDREIMTELAGDGSDRILVISADGDKKAFPAVLGLYASRPASIPGWKVIAFRPRDPDGSSIEMSGRKADPKQIKFIAEQGGEKLDVILFVPGFTSPKEWGNLLYVLLDHTVGEYDMETRIGGIEFMPLERAPNQARPLAELPALVDSLPAAR